jgi:hypothetical protein
VSTLSQTLETLIVLVAIYAGSATICSLIIEAFAGALQLRGSTLYRGLVDLAEGWDCRCALPGATLWLV